MKTRLWENEVLDVPPEERQGKSDYLFLLSKGVCKEQRKEFYCWDIFINWAVCLKCKDYIRSFNIHDYRSCSCWAVSVDWWSWYCKRSGNPEDYIDVIENFQDC